MQSDAERAKIFMPFAALDGFYESIINKEKDFYFSNKVLSEKIDNLKINDLIKISFFYGIDFVETKGRLKKIDKDNKVLFVSESIIEFDSIIDILKIN